MAGARLDKLLAERGLGTRKEVRRFVKKGLVAVDGEPVKDVSMHVPDGAEVTLNGEPVLAPPPVVIYHKPNGVVSTTEDPWGRPCLGTEMASYLALGLHPVGRLDAETTGLMLFMQDGTITQRMLHPKYAVEREYLARVENVPDDRLVQTLAAGVETAEGRFAADVLAIEGDVVRLVVREGKHRMVRRILANSGHPVLDLQRVRFGEVRLGDLPEGDARLPTEAEAAWLAER
ncbi:MAG: pseudouridine synthase [Bradymonadia bacterium]